MSAPTSFRLRGASHKVALTAHVLSSVGWFGVAVLVAFCGVAASVTGDPSLPVAFYRTMQTALWISIPAGIVAVITGVVLSLGTKWGIVRHWWVVAKIVIAIAVIVTDSTIIASAASTAASTGAASSPLRDGTIAHCIVLAGATALSVFKPKGRTPYGRRLVTETPAARNMVESR
jgi:hypothetical protein